MYQFVVLLVNLQLCNLFDRHVNYLNDKIDKFHELHVWLFE